MLGIAQHSSPKATSGKIENLKRVFAVWKDHSFFFLFKILSPVAINNKLSLGPYKQLKTLPQLLKERSSIA